MIAAIAGQRSWTAEAFAGDGRFSTYVSNLDGLRVLPKGSWIFFVHWSDKVPTDVTSDYVCVGFHMTPLPYGRGGNPLQNLILLGHKQTRLTSYRMTEELDAGPIYMQEGPIDIDVGAAEGIYHYISILALDMAHRIWVQKPEPKPQEGEAVTFRRLEPEDSFLPARLSVDELFDRIRMLDAPGTLPSAYLRYGNMIVHFTKARHYGAFVTAEALISCES